MKIKNLLLTALVVLATAVGIVWAADHIDAPAVTATASDITDYYAFQSPENADNLVFVANLQGLLDPAATASAKFDEQVMVEFNIDNTGDAVEDLVIQAVFRDGKVQVYGPVAPSESGLMSQVETDGGLVEAEITQYNETAKIGSGKGMKVFAGPRDDPFFFDFAQYSEIIAGNATSFNEPGADTFAGTNVLSVVVEVPKSMLGNAAALNTWVESKRKI
ncbi:MAG: DUF4331 family protein [Phaeodactylibacter sp.]|nr:DUF4331 family protein [Phaeodactylibacter sp.]MCB9048331.1 DUF4331 family protein [Lewinellaceae bacterium]